MLWWSMYLMGLMSVVGGSIQPQQPTQHGAHQEDEVDVTSRPHIYYCRSPNMEVFTCWWHPLDNSSQGDGNVTYTLTYSIEKEQKMECPDYKTGGPNSCHFDSSQTSVWRIYCMEVTARTSRGNFTSMEHCLDVANIVQTDAPVNLTYTLVEAGEDETGHTALLSWTYPVPAHIQFGWITLVYELQYHRVAKPGNWKVKGQLREPHVALMGLPVGDYVVRVRCRSRNKGLWSKWSSSVLLSIPAEPSPDKLVALILATGVGVVALLVISFRIIPQSKRIRAFFLPPIPKPRIKGIDPSLLKKGRIDEINRHFTSFHCPNPPRYIEEVWHQVSMSDDNQPFRDFSGVSPSSDKGDTFITPTPAMGASLASRYQLIQSRTGPYTPGSPPAPYCSSPAVALPFPGTDSSPWTWPGTAVPAPYQPEMMSYPGTDYSVLGDTSPAAGSLVPSPAVPFFTVTSTSTSTNTNTVTMPQDFYTCVHVLSGSTEVHLVPCVPVAEAPPRQHILPEQKAEKKKQQQQQQLQQADYLTSAMENAMTTGTGTEDGGSDEQNEAALPLLPVGVDNRI